jgi:hypothetical protein
MFRMELGGSRDDKLIATRRHLHLSVSHAQGEVERSEGEF